MDRLVDRPLDAHRDASATDLCKRILNAFGVNRALLDSAATWIETLRDEFRTFIERYGVAQTAFYLPQRGDPRVLAKWKGNAVGLEVYSSLFLLPFHTTNLDAAGEVASLVADAIVSYRRKVRLMVPEWVKGFAFGGEAALLRQKSELTQQLETTEQALAEWMSYKAVLVTSGELLKTKLVTILSGYFCLNVDPLDEYREDFKILGFGEDPKVEALGECKGVKTGTKREHINQVDSHRERSGLDELTPGLLIINNQMDIESLEGRANTTVAPEQVRHARSFNVLVVRSIDFLWLMFLWESKSPRERGDEFLKLLGRGGGWLHVGPDGLKVETD